MKPVALVTGAAKRVGRVIAGELAQRGYRLVLHANSSLDEAKEFAAELKQQGIEAICVAANLREPAAIEKMVVDAVAHYGQIDALVHSAAIWNSKPLEKTTPDDVREHFEVNTLGTFLMCQHVGLQMVKQRRGGAIVNLGDWAIERPYVDYAAYFASKGSIPTLTRTFAVELAQRNPWIRVNAVMPGPVMLPDDMPADERQAVISATLAQREGSPHHVADAVAMLLENDYITGVTLPVDGGRSIFTGKYQW